MFDQVISEHMISFINPLSIPSGSFHFSASWRPGCTDGRTKTNTRHWLWVQQIVSGRAITLQHSKCHADTLNELTVLTWSIVTRIWMTFK